MRYYIEEDTSTTPPTLVKVPIDGSFINYNTAPIGSIQQYSGTSLPPGWLWCNGAAYSRQYFPFLFKVIGTTYGTGDGSTTFNVPTIPDLATGIKYIIKAYSTADAKDLGIDAADPQDLPEIPGKWGNIEDWTTTINSITPETDWVAPATGMLTFFPVGVPAGTTSRQLRTCLTEMRNGVRLPSHIWCSCSVDADGFISQNNSAGIIEKGHVYQILNPGAGFDNVYNAMFTPYVTDSTEPVDDPGEVYTTTETKVGTWIDGKPIYRKVVELTNTTPEVNAGMDRTIFRYNSVMTGIEKVINIIGCYTCYRTDISENLTMNWSNSILNSNGTIAQAAGGITNSGTLNLYTSFRTSINPTNSCTIQAAIEYTKL